MEEDQAGMLSQTQLETNKNSLSELDMPLAPSFYRSARMLYEVRAAANKGLGLFAEHVIPRGTRILAQKPIIALGLDQRPSDILSHAKQLPKESRDQLLGLSWDAGNGIRRVGRWGEVLAWTVKDCFGSHGEVVREEGSRKTIREGSGGVFKDVFEAFQIVSIFRSNSFHLAPSATSASTKSHCSSWRLADSTTWSGTGPSSSPPYKLALFLSIARINHSCLPNAQANYHALDQTFNVHATRDIAVGEEVSINYLPEHGQLRDQRVAMLEEGYGFTCNCPACDLSTERGREGETRRKGMQARIRRTRAYMADGAGAQETVEAGYGADGMPETLTEHMAKEMRDQMDALNELAEDKRREWVRDSERQLLESMVGFYQMEGIAGREVASMYYHLARLNWESGNYEDAVGKAEAGLRLEEDCLGGDHPECIEAARFVGSLAKGADGVK